MERLKINEVKWNLAHLLKGDNDESIEEQKKIIEKNYIKFIKKWKNNNIYLNNPEVLKQALDEYNDLIEKFGGGGNIGFYFYLRDMQDQINPELKASNSKIEEFSKKLENEAKFFMLNIAKIPEKEQKKFIEFEDLKDYKHILERLFENAKYNLSENEEKIMNLKSKSSHEDWVDMVAKLISKEEKVVLVNNKEEKKSFSELASLINEQNKKTRDSAANAINEILTKYVDVAEAEINAILGNKKVNDELRGMPRPDFARHLSDDIDSEVVDTIIRVVSKRFYISNKYYKLKSRLMKVKYLEYHERNVPYGKLDEKYSYEDAINLIYSVFNKLDKEFGEILKRFNNNGQIDVYPKRGKRNGAFCCYQSKIHPVYILLNYSDKIEYTRVIAHELGHAINNELMKKKQNALNFSNPLSIAEVTSIFMEDFIIQELLKVTDDEMKLAIMMMKLNDDISTIYRQIACYMFEQELHSRYREKGYLSKDEIGNLFQKHMKAYMGDYVEQSIGSENWWVHWSHIRKFFYNYSYTSGALISKSMQSFVKKDPKFIHKVKEFLSIGRSKSPRNAFMELGIDITKESFWSKGLEETEKLLEETEKLAIRMGKI